MKAKRSVTALSLAAIAAQLAAQTNGQRYNVVFIMSDDHTAQMMSCYDTTNIRTPNLDRVAENGVKFTNSFVANSISGPSRACMLTGKHSHTNGFISNEKSVFDGSQQTLPKLLQKAGYETAIIGKWHLGTTPTGFDYWRIFPGQGDYYNPRFITPDSGTVAVPGYVTNVVTDMSLDWLENKHDKSKPFVLFIQHKACHRNWLPEEKYLSEYENKTFKLPSTFYDTYEGREAAATQEMEIGKHMDLAYDSKLYLLGNKTPLTNYYTDVVGRMTTSEKVAYDKVYGPISQDFFSRNLQGKELAEFKFQRYMRDYAKVVKSLDDNVGRVLDYLEKHDMLKNTLVVYTSDQGFYMGEHGWFDKRFMYEESLNTPLVMSLPEGLKAQGDITQIVQNIDYAPTILDLVGADIPSDIQGISMLPLLKGDKKSPKWRDAIYYHFHEYPAEHAVKRHYGIRTNRYKLIHFYNDIDTWELYDLQADPHELNNIYGKKGTEKITKNLRKRLWELQVEYDDPIRLQYPLQ